jgi:hypothetical protein
VTVATAADGAAVERPAAPVDKPRRSAVRSAAGVRILAGGESANNNNGGEADKARSATTAATVDAAAVALLAARLSALAAQRASKDKP